MDWSNPSNCAESPTVAEWTSVGAWLCQTEYGLWAFHRQIIWWHSSLNAGEQQSALPKSGIAEVGTDTNHGNKAICFQMRRYPKTVPLRISWLWYPLQQPWLHPPQACCSAAWLGASSNAWQSQCFSLKLHHPCSSPLSIPLPHCLMQWHYHIQMFWSKNQ